MAAKISTEWILKDEVLAMTGAGYTSLHCAMRRGDFPKGKIHFGKRRWRKHDIEAWLERQPDESVGRDCVKANEARARNRADAA